MAGAAQQQVAARRPQAPVASSSKARRPVASSAVMLRSRRMTICGSVGNVLEERTQLVGRTEQKRPMNAEDSHVAAESSCPCRMCTCPSLHVVVGDGGHGRGVRDALDEQQGGAHHADADRLRQVGEHRERERDDPDRDVGLRQPQQLRNLRPVAHVVGDDHQDGGQHRQRHVARERRRQRAESSASVERMHDAGDRRLRARSDVGRGPGDGAGRGQPAKERRRDVGDALRDRAPCSSRAGRRSSGRRPWPTSATRSRRASPPSSPAR